MKRCTLTYRTLTKRFGLEDEGRHLPANAFDFWRLFVTKVRPTLYPLYQSAVNSACLKLTRNHVPLQQNTSKWNDFHPSEKLYNSNLNLRRGSQSWGSSFNAVVLPWWLLVTRVWNKLTSNSYQQAESSTRKSHGCHDVMGQKPSTFREVGDGSVAPVRHPSVFSTGSQLLEGATGMWQVWWGFCDAKDPE